MSRQHRHRENKVKKMHTIIGGYEKVLEELGKIPQVRSVITGVISPHKSEQEELTFQYFTDAGLKLLAKTTEAIQEIFIVCVEEDKQQVLAELRTRGHLKEKVKKMKKGKSKGSNKQQQSQQRDPLANYRVGKNDLPKEKGTTLKDMLNPEMLQKLQAKSSEMKEQERIQEETRRQTEIARREKEQKELENNFEYLLNNTKQDWKKFK
ncbi:YqkE family protein [Tumebacillus lipolyticus]|uniref:YqkE family protein n=1 Tax=Tumebacillus lipolyticus TaxID=1280370 RepID=A0ABW5A2K0_9BACL